MDSYTNGQYPPYGPMHAAYVATEPKKPVPAPNAFSRAAIILGIVAIASIFTFTVYPPIILGCLAILMAALSKGYFRCMNGGAKAGLIMGIVALVLNMVIVVGSLTLVFTNEELREEFNEVFEEMYGESFDEYLEDL